MGTTYHLTWLPEESSPRSPALREEVEAILERVDASMSTYREDSEIFRFNLAEVGEEIVVSDYFIKVFEISRMVSERSEGAYDVTVAPLVDLWGFGPGGGDGVPSDEAVAGALGMVGESWVDVSPATNTIRKRRPLELDFSSVAKGYAVDLLAERLGARGVRDYMVEIGGELRVAGSSPRGNAWRIAIERPASGSDGIAAALSLHDAAVATSGDYRNFFELEGVRYSHSIDPRSGRPVRHALVSGTVVHPSAAAADAWATALTVLGPEDALRIATEERLAAYLISRAGEDFRAEKTPAIEAFLR